MLIFKGKDPMWYIALEQHNTWQMKSPFNFFHIKGQVVYLGDYTSHHIEGQGYVDIILTHGQKKTIPYALHVASLVKNLLFIKKVN